ncbi:MAG: lactate utilization protein C [Acidobacteriota bacterium]
MSRSRVLEKLRRIARQTGTVPELPSALPEFPRYDDPLRQFQREVEGVGGVFLEGRGEEELRSSLAEVLTASRTERIFWEDQPLFEKHRIPHRLRDPLAFKEGHLVFSDHFRGKVQFPCILSSKPYRRRHLASIRLSASSAACGLAETGTVVHETGPGKGRLLSILPPSHLVLLSRQDLLMHSLEFFQSVEPGKRASLLTMVTGPSRTADIEKTLTVGVHGPRQWFVILTD